MATTVMRLARAAAAAASTATAAAPAGDAGRSAPPSVMTTMMATELGRRCARMSAVPFAMPAAVLV